jgi:glycosyltransferase involved in cell wall biosynthesis
MKIVIINDYAKVQGGSAQVAIKSAVGLARLGYTVTFVYGGGGFDSSLDHKNITLLDLGQYDLLSNPSKIDAAKNGLWNFEVERKLFAFLRFLDVSKTIVHIHSWVKSLSTSVFSVVFRLNLSCVVTLHDYFSVCPNGGLYNYQRKRVCLLRPMSCGCFFSNCDSRSYYHKLWRYLRQVMYAKSKFPNNVINFITVSKYSELILRQFLPMSAKYWHISNPVESIQNSPASPHKSKIFTYVGRLSQEKGLELLLELKCFTGKSLRFVGIGDLEPILKQKFPEAKFLGWCSWSEIDRVLTDTRALLFTSQLYETHGLVVAEAAARGVPSIVSNISAAKDYVEHKKTGLLFQSGSTRSLEEQMKVASKDDSLVEAMGAECYTRYWNSPLSLDSHVNDLLNCYNSILEKCRN